MKKEDLKFRYFKGEKECPWDGNVREQFKQAHFWLFEKITAESGAKEISEFYTKIRDDISDPYFGSTKLLDAEVPEGERAVAAYCMFVSDGSMPIEALGEYFAAIPFVLENLAD